MKKIIVLLLLSVVFLVAQNYHPKYLEGLKAFNNGKYQEAEKLFSVAIEDDFFDAELYYMRGLSLIYQNRFADAITDLTEAIKLNPNHADAYNSRGLCYSYLNQLKIALPDFNKAIKLDSSLAQAYINRASLYLTEEQNQKAKDDLDMALKLDPNNPELYIQRGRLNHKMGNYESAIKDFSAVIRMGMNNNKIYYNRANSYYKSGKFEKAVRDYSKAIELDSNDNEALNNRAMAYEQLGLTDLAYKDREKLNNRLKIFFTPVDELSFKRFKSSNGEISLELPDSWYKYEQKLEHGYTVLISKDSLNPMTDMMRVGVTITVERDMYERYNLLNDPSVMEFWKGSQQLNSSDYHQYLIKSRTDRLYHGYPEALNVVKIQADPRFLEFQMYEHVIAYKGNIVYIYMQSPTEEFEYYKQIFDKTVESVKIDVSVAENENN